jgi:hypothetical protein
VAIAAHRQQDCTEAAALHHQHVGRFVFFADNTILDGVDAMMAKMQNGIIGLQTSFIPSFSVRTT